MASVREGAQAPDLPRTSDELGREIERMQAELDRATQLGGLRNDPTLPLIRALSASLGLQWRLHDQAVGYFHSASSRLDRQLADTIAQGEQALETRRVAIVEKLAPVSFRTPFCLLKAAVTIMVAATTAKSEISDASAALTNSISDCIPAKSIGGAPSASAIRRCVTE